MAAARPQVCHHFLGDPVRRPPPLLCPQREIDIPYELTQRQDPLDTLRADHEIGHLGDDLQVFHVPQVQGDNVLVEPCVADSFLEHAQVVPRDLRVLYLRKKPPQNPIVEVHAGIDVFRAHAPAEIACVGPDPVEERRGHLAVHFHDPCVPQILGEDRRGTPVIGADVVILGEAGLCPDGHMVVDNDVGDDGFRKGVIPGARLSVHQGNPAEILEIDLRKRPQIDLQLTDHGPVFGPPHDTAGSDDAADFPLRLE